MRKQYEVWANEYKMRIIRVSTSYVSRKLFDLSLSSSRLTKGGGTAEERLREVNLPTLSTAQFLLGRHTDESNLTEDEARDIIAQWRRKAKRAGFIKLGSYTI